MLYLLRNEDLSVAVLETARDSYIDFKKLDENLFCIGGSLLYNFQTREDALIKLKELGLNSNDYITLEFKDIINLINKGF